MNDNNSSLGGGGDPTNAPAPGPLMSYLSETPDGLSVVAGTAEGIGPVFRASCEGHEICRDRGMRWMVRSADELTEHVYPAFEDHVQTMTECGEPLTVDEQDGGPLADEDTEVEGMELTEDES